MAEKRYIKRHRRRFVLRFGLEEATRLGFTEDISMEGMFIRTSNIYPPGTTLVVNITLPDEVIVSLKGKVIWTKQVPPNMTKIDKKAGFGFKIDSFSNGEELYRLTCKKSLVLHEPGSISE